MVCLKGFYSVPTLSSGSIECSSESMESSVNDNVENSRLKHWRWFMRSLNVFMIIFFKQSFTPWKSWRPQQNPPFPKTRRGSSLPSADFDQMIEGWFSTLEAPINRRFKHSIKPLDRVGAPWNSAYVNWIKYPRTEPVDRRDVNSPNFSWASGTGCILAKNQDVGFIIYIHTSVCHWLATRMEKSKNGIQGRVFKLVL